MYELHYKNDLTEKVGVSGLRFRTREEAQKVADARNRSYLAIYTFKHFFVAEVN